MRIYLDNNFKVIKTQDFDVQFVQFNQVEVEVYTTLAQADRTVGYNWVRPDGYKTQQVAMTYQGTVVENSVTYYTWAANITPYHTAIIPGTQDYGFALVSFTITKILNDIVTERFTSPVLRITVIRSIEPEISIIAPSAVEAIDVRLDNLEAFKLNPTLLHYPQIKASGAISKGDVVMFAGADGNNIIGTKATSVAVNANPKVIMGIANENIANNASGYVKWFGLIEGLNTNSYNLGDLLYFNHAVAGGLTNVKPTLASGNLAISVAAVVKKSAGDGHIVVRPTLVDENIYERLAALEA